MPASLSQHPWVTDSPLAQLLDAGGVLVGSDPAVLTLSHGSKMVASLLNRGLPLNAGLPAEQISPGRIGAQTTVALHRS